MLGQFSVLKLEHVPKDCNDKADALAVVASVDPTRSTGRRDSLLNEKKMLVDFRILENPSPRRNSFSLESPLTFCCYFIKEKTK